MSDPVICKFVNVRVLTLGQLTTSIAVQVQGLKRLETLTIVIDHGTTLENLATVLTGPHPPHTLTLVYTTTPPFKFSMMAMLLQNIVDLTIRDDRNLADKRRPTRAQTLYGHMREDKKVFSTLDNLQNLWIDSFHGHMDGDLDRFSRVPHLQRLELTNMPSVDRMDLRFIACHFRCLTTLKMSYMCVANDLQATTTWAIIQKNPVLERFKSTNSVFGDMAGFHVM
jgi:hypothetical protein